MSWDVIQPQETFIRSLPERPGESPGLFCRVTAEFFSWLSWVSCPS